MINRASNSAYFTLLCGGLVLSACACEEPPPNNNNVARIIMSSGQGTVLAADGSANLTLSIRALDAEGAADPATLTVSTSGGRFEVLNDIGTIDANGETFTVTPDGAVDVSFFCTPQQPEQVIIQATNGNATSNLNVSCIDPPGQIILDIDVADCESLTASPNDSCRLEANLNLVGLDQSETPQEGVRLTFEVTDAIPQSPGDPTDFNVLALNANGTGQDSVSQVTDGTGVAPIFVFGKNFDLTQTLTINVSGTAANGTQVEQTVVVTADPFVNLAALTLPAEISVATGENATIDITAIDEQGLVADGDEVTLTVPEDSGATFDNGETSIVVTLDATGFGSAVFTAPDVTVLSTVVVSATYIPDPAIQPILDTVNMKIFPEGALIVNANAAPRSIESDLNESSIVTVTVERLVNGALELVSGVDVTMSIAAADLERVGIGARAGDVAVAGELAPAVTVQSDAAGEATAQVSSTNTRVRGTTTVEVFVNDVANGETAETTIEIEVDRQPILQSIVFLSAEPRTIGVRGSAYPSSSLIQFQILDDLNNPIPNAAVAFDVNATADPAASVVGDALTNAEGIASTVLAAGTQAGPISVVATASFNGNILTAESLPVVVTGGLPTFENSYILCARTESINTGFFTASCTAHLVDRFSNRVPADLGVHFRAEAANMTPTVFTDDDGEAIAEYQSNPIVGTTASMLSAFGDSWSYGAIIPNAGDLTENGAFVNADCFDNDSRSPCHTLDLCFEPANAAFCPLTLDATFPGDGCWEHLNAYALTGDIAHIGPELVTAFAAVTNQAEAAALAELQAFNFASINGLNYFVDDDPNAVSVHERVEVIVDTYLANRNRCGQATACIAPGPNRALIQGGLNFINFDGCNLVGGCMDFATSTECPVDGISTVMAVSRGEESFVDTNGNGEFDFDDVNGNGLHDRGEPTFEPFVDMPEPFIDGNENCLRDDLTGSVRLATFDEIRHTDLYFDEDASGDFGYTNPDDPNGPRLLFNEQWDRDKQIFMKNDVVQLTGNNARLDFGTPCPQGSIPDVTQVTCADGATLATCREAGPFALMADCPQGLTIQDNDVFQLGYRWIDGHGNCFSPEFGASAAAEGDGPFELTGAVTRELEEDECGLTARAAPNPDRPWCATQTQAGSRVFSVSIKADCDDGDPGANPASVAFTSTAGNTDTYDFNINCP